MSSASNYDRRGTPAYLQIDHLERRAKYLEERVDEQHETIMKQSKEYEDIVARLQRATELLESCRGQNANLIDQNKRLRDASTPPC